MKAIDLEVKRICEEKLAIHFSVPKPLRVPKICGKMIS